MQRQTPGGAGRMGVLGRRTRGEPTSERSERTSQPPPSTTSGHCLRVRPGSPITYVHDKVVALKPPARACPPGGLVPSPYRLHGDLNGTRHPPIVFGSKEHRSKPYFHLFTPLRGYLSPNPRSFLFKALPCICIHLPSLAISTGSDQESALKAREWLQNSPSTSPASFTKMLFAAGTRGNPGMVIISPQITTINSAPADRRTSLIGTV